MSKKSLLTMAVAMCLSLCGCSGSGESSSSSSSSKGYYDVDTSTPLGRHENKIKNLSSSFSGRGYSLLIPQTADEKTKKAASEIRKFIYDSAGVELPIVNDNGQLLDRPYVSIGKTSVFINASIIIPSGLKENGYSIETKDNNYFIIAESSKGLLNGAYGFLERMISFSAFAKDESSFSRGEIFDKEMHVIEVPDINYRIANNGTTVEGDEGYRERLLYDCPEDTFMMVGGSLWHNAFSYIDPEINKDKINWFSESDGLTDYKQLCYSGHGNSGERKAMLFQVASKIVETARDSLESNVTFMQADINSWCQCEACKKEKQHYGTDSAVLIHFLNDLSSLLDEELAKANMKDRKVDICFFAYQKTENAPANKNADGTYSPIDDTVVLKDNVTVFYAPIYGDFNRSLDDPKNKNVAETFKAWKSISKKIYAWLYQTNYSYYLYPYNSLPTMQARYRFLFENSVEYLWDESQWDQDVPTTFHSLKNYMSAKLSWNCSDDYESLLDDYFSSYFKDAGKVMREYFDELCAHMTSLLVEKGMSGGIYAPVSDTAYFPKGLLDQWNRAFSNGYKAIAHYEWDDPEVFEKLTRRLKIENLFVCYALIGLYPGRFSKEELGKMQKDFRDDCYLYNVVRVSETVDIQTIFDGWSY